MSIFLSLSGHCLHRYSVNILHRVMSYIKLWYLQHFAFFIRIYRARDSDYTKLAYKSAISNVRKKNYILFSYLLLLLLQESWMLQEQAILWQQEVFI